MPRKWKEIKLRIERANKPTLVYSVWPPVVLNDYETGTFPVHYPAPNPWWAFWRKAPVIHYGEYTVIGEVVSIKVGRVHINCDRKNVIGLL